MSTGGVEVCLVDRVGCGVDREGGVDFDIPVYQPLSEKQATATGLEKDTSRKEKIGEV
jgi:hypothetical protein